MVVQYHGCKIKDSSTGVEFEFQISVDWDMNAAHKENDLLTKDI